MGAEGQHFVPWLGSAIAVGIIASMVRVWWICARNNFRWYRRWCGGHWEQWYIDMPVGITAWLNERYCDRPEDDIANRPGLGRGRPTCEDWPVMAHPWRVLILGRHWAYGSYLLRHKWHVVRAAFKMRLSWSVKRVAILHDASKFLPSEWVPYANHFYLADGTSRSKLGGDGFLDHPKDDPAFNMAWLLHYKRNKHHPQHYAHVVASPCHDPDYFLLADDNRAKCLTCLRVYERVDAYEQDGPAHGKVVYVTHQMPEPYLTEMLVDWIGAGMAQGNPDTLGWYALRGINHPMHPNTRRAVERMLGYPENLPMTGAPS